MYPFFGNRKIENVFKMHNRVSVVSFPFHIFHWHKNSNSNHKNNFQSFSTISKFSM